MKLPIFHAVTMRFFCCLGLRVVLSAVLLSVSIAYYSSAYSEPVYFFPRQADSEQIKKHDRDDRSYGLPLYRIDRWKWFDLTIDMPDHPETAGEVAEQRNRDTQLQRFGRSNDNNLFPDTDELTDGLRLRFHYLFD